MLKHSRLTATRLRQQEQSGDDNTSKVDFEQLQITNQRVLETISHRNRQLLHLKSVSSNILNAADSEQQALETAGVALQVIQSEIDNRESILRRLTKEHQTVLADRKRAAETNHALRKRTERFSVPATIDYVRDKQRLYADRQQAGTLQRRLEIAEVELAQHRKVWYTLQHLSPV